MSGFLDWIRDHPLVLHFDVLDYYDVDDATLVKLRLVLTDGSLLFTKEYLDESTRKYAFQWQKADNTWLMRWGNVPHSPKLSSFPDHKHDYRQGIETVSDSTDITLIEVLAYINNQLMNL